MAPTISKIVLRVLSMSLEGWKTAFEITGVILLGLTFLSGAGVLITSNRLNARQAERLRQFDKDLTGAKTELGKQQERAAKADERVAGLEQEAVNAKTEMAKEQTRAAEAERSLLALQEKIHSRHLSAQQKEAIKNALKGFPPQQVNILAFVGAPDGTSFGLELADAVNSAGWKATFLGAEASGGEIRGIALVMKDTKRPPPGTKQLQNALKAAGLEAPAWNHPQWGGPESVITVLIAPKQM